MMAKLDEIERVSAVYAIHRYLYSVQLPHAGARAVLPS